MQAGFIQFLGIMKHQASPTDAVLYQECVIVLSFVYTRGVVKCELKKEDETLLSFQPANGAVGTSTNTSIIDNNSSVLNGSTTSQVSHVTVHTT